MAFVDLKTVVEIHSFSKSLLREFIKMGCPHYRKDKKIWLDHDEFCKWFSDSFRVESKSETTGNIDQMMTEFISGIE